MSHKLSRQGKSGYLRCLTEKTGKIYAPGLATSSVCKSGGVGRGGDFCHVLQDETSAGMGA